MSEVGSIGNVDGPRQDGTEKSVISDNEVEPMISEKKSGKISVIKIMSI